MSWGSTNGGQYFQHTDVTYGLIQEGSLQLGGTKLTIFLMTTQLFTLGKCETL